MSSDDLFGKPHLRRIVGDSENAGIETPLGEASSALSADCPGLVQNGGLPPSTARPGLLSPAGALSDWSERLGRTFPDRLSPVQVS